MNISFSINIVLGLALSCSPLFGQEWTELVPATSAVPSGRSNATLVYNREGRSVILFGGRNGGGNLNDVWSFNIDSREWTNSTPVEGPSPDVRFGHVAVFDASSGKMHIWSGQGSGFYNDAWTYEVESRRWTKDSSRGMIPNARYGSAGIFDPSSGRMVMFAGFTDQGRFDDTRAYATDSGAWMDDSSLGTKPGRRCLHTMAFDPSGHRMLLFGGQRSGPLDDLWSFDLSSQTWSELVTAERPTGRFFATSGVMGGRLWVFGGSTAQGTTEELWSFDLGRQAWTKAAMSGSWPSKRHSHAAAVIQEDESMIIVGGFGGTNLSDVWKLSVTSSSVTNPHIQPAEFTLSQNYPNPFNPTTTITFTAKNAARFTLDVFNALGQQIARLADESFPSGEHSFEWNALGIPTGVYTYRLRSGHQSQTRTMVIVR